MLNATALIATPETDAELAEKYRAAGRHAALAGLRAEACQHLGGRAQQWWMEGWESVGELGKAFGGHGPLIGG